MEKAKGLIPQWSATMWWFVACGAMIAYGVFTVSNVLSAKIALWFGVPADQAIGITAFLCGAIGAIVKAIHSFFSNLHVSQGWENRKKKAEDFKTYRLWAFVSGELILIAIAVYIALKVAGPYGWASYGLLVVTPLVCGTAMIVIPGFLAKLVNADYRKLNMDRGQVIRMAIVATISTVVYALIGYFVIVDLVHNALNVLTTWEEHTKSALSWFVLGATFVLNLVMQADIEFSEALGFFKQDHAKGSGEYRDTPTPQKPQMPAHTAVASGTLADKLAEKQRKTA